MKRIKKIERHTVIYTDYFEVSDEEFISKFGSWNNFINSEESDEYKVNSQIDEISNRQGTAEVEWVLEDKT